MPRTSRSLAELAGIKALRDHESTRLLVLGALVGVLGGLAAGAFDLVRAGLGHLFFGANDPSLGGGHLVAVLLAPVLGGLVAGGLIHLLGGRKPRVIPEVIESLAHDNGRMPLRAGLASALAAAVAVGSGHSAGREGPIVQLSSTLASWLSQRLGLTAHRARVLVASAAAAAIAASFDAPLGASFFALEILLGNFALSSFTPVVVAAVTGTVVGQVLLGERVAFHLPSFAVEHPAELLVYPLLGLACGLVAIGLRRMLRWARQQWERLTVIPPWARPALAGLGVGVLGAVGLHQVMGNGYGFVQQLLSGEDPGALLLLAILAAKLVATTASVSSGSGAGVFAPSLVIGAITGALFGSVGQLLLPEMPPHAAMGTVGMGAVAAALAHAPLTMGLTLFEMTRDYSIVLPLLLTLATATLVSSVFERRSLYLQILVDRGVDVDRSREELVMYDMHVQEVMRGEDHVVAREGISARELAALFLSRRVHDVWLLDEEKRLVGLVDILDARKLLGDQAQLPPVSSLMRKVPHLSPQMALAESMPLFFRSGREALPVCDADGRFVGVLHERDVVGAYDQEVLRKDALLARMECGPAENRHTDLFELPPGYVMERVQVTGQLIGHSLRDLRLPSRFGVTVVAVDVQDPERGTHARNAPAADLEVKAGDRLVVVGPLENVAALKDDEIEDQATQVLED